MPKFGASAAILSFALLVTPTVVLAHGGHGDEFSGENKTNQSTSSISVDLETAKRLGIEVEPVSRQRLAIAIKSTGQIEALPNRQVEVKAPVDGTLVELLVQPGDRVKQGQPVAVLSSAELAQLRTEALTKQAEAQPDLQKAQADLNLARQNYDRQRTITEAEIAQAQTQLIAAQKQYDRDRSLVNRGELVAVARENYQRQVQIANAEITQAQTQLTAAQKQYDRDLALVNSAPLVAVAKQNYQRQVQIADAEIEQAKTQLAVAQEKYDRDKTLAEAGALPRRQMMESKAQLAEAQALLVKAQSRQNVLQAETEIQRAQVELPLRDLRESQAKLAEAQAQLVRAKQRANVLQADTELKRAQTELPLRELRESEAKLAEAKASFTRALSRREMLGAENQVKVAQSNLQAAQSRVRLASTAYQTRLQQLGAIANERGQITVLAPISGTVADREVTQKESVLASETPLMTILNETSVFATANIYEKDLNRVGKGQEVRVKIASLPDRTFTGRISVVGSTVAGETRVVAVKAAIDNSEGVLKPGMFAELEILTNERTNGTLAIPSAAVVDANGKTIVYVQNGNAYQATEVTLGQTSGDLVEVKSGLFEDDEIVTQRAPQLYAQSLRGGNKTEEQGNTEAQKPSENSNSQPLLPWWGITLLGGAIAVGTFFAGNFWANRRLKSRLLFAGNSPTEAVAEEIPVDLDGHKQPTLSGTPIDIGEPEKPQKTHPMN
ncbi:MAG: efflux RND transporter periplasmic adaptor subunit [Cyanosarcina radialis HA8281-LM2]|jgi:RND family efflux transporter MFP subunit|nr:efflux RND transporter periplasmic adaptor subunit [Cyanosarcina radialis HA8281-LM2]